MCDAFLVLAQAPDGLELLPGAALDAGRRAATRLRLQRLKDKLGNRSNASREVELDGAWRLLVGEEGRGIPTIIEMGNLHAARLRHRLGRPDAPGGGAGDPSCAAPQRLPEAPRRPAADDQRARRSRARSPRRRRRSRCAWRAPMTAEDAGETRVPPPADAGREVLDLQARRRRSPLEAMEVLGGNGYVEESIMPRLYREMPVNSDLGGLGQRHVPRRAARPGETAEARRRLPGGDPERRAAATGASIASSATLETELGAARRAEEGLARRLVGRMAVGTAGGAAGAARAAGRRRRVLRRAFGERGRRDFRYAAGRCRQSRDRRSRRSRMNETSPTPSASDDQPSRRGRGPRRRARSACRRRSSAMCSISAPTISCSCFCSPSPSF